MLFLVRVILVEFKVFKSLEVIFLLFFEFFVGGKEYILEDVFEKVNCLFVEDWWDL